MKRHEHQIEALEETALCHDVLETKRVSNV
jgi:hypothetical protein